ncbi:hypothetical protein ACLKA7_007596 [Drosophila subpalustris]
MEYFSFVYSNSRNKRKASSTEYFVAVESDGVGMLSFILSKLVKPVFVLTRHVNTETGLCGESPTTFTTGELTRAIDPPNAGRFFQSVAQQFKPEQYSNGTAGEDGLSRKVLNIFYVALANYPQIFTSVFCCDTGHDGDSCAAQGTN